MQDPTFRRHFLSPSSGRTLEAKTVCDTSDYNFVRVDTGVGLLPRTREVLFITLQENVVSYRNYFKIKAFYILVKTSDFSGGRFIFSPPGQLSMIRLASACRQASPSLLSGHDVTSGGASNSPPNTECVCNFEKLAIISEEQGSSYGHSISSPC